MRTTSLTALFVVTLLGTAADAILCAQQPAPTVADGIYTAVQATRGAAAYDAACVRCHRADLGGADGPALKEDRFNRAFAGKSLQRLFARVTTTMPKGAPGSLAEGVYLDIIAHLLRENGFPAGAKELSADAVEGVVILPTRPKPLAPVSDFSYVEVSGCLSQARDGGWLLGPASDPVAVKPAIAGPATAHDSMAPRRSERTFQLIDAVAFSPEQYRGHLLRVRGILIGLPAELRLTISSLETLAPTCR